MSASPSMIGSSTAGGDTLVRNRGLHISLAWMLYERVQLRTKAMTAWIFDREHHGSPAVRIGLIVAAFLPLVALAVLFAHR